MKETIYLYVSREGVQRMRKSLTSLHRGEIPVKIKVEIDKDAFQPPTIEKKIRISRWDSNIDMEDIEFKKDVITNEEAEIIKNKRIEKMKEILTNQGYTVVENEEQ